VVTQALAHLSEAATDLYPLPQLGFYVLVGFVYYRVLRSGAAAGAGSFLRFCFAREVWSSKSAKTDYLLVVLNQFIVLPLAALAVPILTMEGLTKTLETTGALPLPLGAAIDTAYALLILVVADFGFWLSHVCLHRIPFLWKFHRVHHSASALNIFTAHRVHPVEKILVSLFQAGAIAIFVLGVARTTGYVPTQATLLATPLIAMALWAQGVLRHSPLRIGYGPLSYLISSPAMHQAHHSSDPRHYNKNFTHFFPIWDLAIGAFYVPKPGEVFAYGLEREEA
jgi:sterol desaturase/sphingolipid hydroxylase (fatty acid hydroxylase superfamily)